MGGGACRSHEHDLHTDLHSYCTLAGASVAGCATITRTHSASRTPSVIATAGEANVFGALLRQHRTRAGLTQEGLAERAQMSVRGVIYLERGTRQPYPDTLHRLAEALALTPAQRDTLADAAHTTDSPNSAPVAPATPYAPLPASPPSLIGRDRELAVLRERFAAVRAGQGSLVLIGGEAGVGKTALAESLAYEAATWGALVLTGRCYDLMETPPYGPWTEIRDHAPVIPDLPPLPSAGTSTAASQAALFREALASFAALAARQPLVLILDDLQWADPASLDLLRFLARSVVSLPILLLATYRAEEVTRRHPLYPLLPLLLREAGATPIELHRLPIADVATLVTDRYRLPEAEATRLVTYLHERAGGNAFFTLELLRALEEEGVLPRNRRAGRSATWRRCRCALLRQVIDSRLARLGAEAERLLAVAAVIGQTVPLALWESVGETDEDALLDLIERAGEARVVVETTEGEGVRFLHALTRQALYEGIPAIRRRRLHGQIGEALRDGARRAPRRGRLPLPGGGGRPRGGVDCGRSSIAQRAIGSGRARTRNKPSRTRSSRANRSPCSPPTACSVNSTPTPDDMRTPECICNHRSISQTPVPRRTSGPRPCWRWRNFALRRTRRTRPAPCSMRCKPSVNRSARNRRWCGPRRSPSDSRGREDESRSDEWPSGSFFIPTDPRLSLLWQAKVKGQELRSWRKFSWWRRFAGAAGAPRAGNLIGLRGMSTCEPWHGHGTRA